MKKTCPDCHRIAVEAAFAAIANKRREVNITIGAIATAVLALVIGVALGVLLF